MSTLKIQSKDKIEIYQNRKWFTISITDQSGSIQDVFEVQDYSTAIEQLELRGQKLDANQRDEIKKFIK